MESSERLKRLLQDDWEIHGDPKGLLLLLREMYLSDETAREALIEIQAANHCTIREMAADIKTLSEWIRLAWTRGTTPSFERTEKVLDVCKKYYDET